MSVARETSDSSDDQPTTPLISAGGNADRCPVCGAQLAVDQRYCVECGTRRGAARFRLAGAPTATAAGAPAPAPARYGAVQRVTRASSGVSLLLGLLILLVAIGIGVLIGHNGNPKTAGQPKVNVVLNGGGSSSAGSSTTASATSNTAGSSSSGSSSKTKSSKSKATSSSTKAASKAATNSNAAAKGKAATAAAAKSFSPSATKKSTVGGSCTSGTAGCVNGKQTGNLF